MGVPDHIARLRAVVGTELLLFPSVALVIVDAAGRLLLVRHAGHHDGWGLVGGAVEFGESPERTAVREAQEEIGVPVRLNALLTAVGGPDYEVTYPNGDRAAYVTVAYLAEIVDGLAVPDGDEICEVSWFTRVELAALALSRNARALLTTTGHLPPGDVSPRADQADQPDQPDQADQADQAGRPQVRTCCAPIG